MRKIEPTASHTDSRKTLVIGCIWIAACLVVFFATGGNPFDELSPGLSDELALIRRSERAVGVLAEKAVDEVEDDRGRVGVSDVGKYLFTALDGGEFTTWTRTPAGQLLNQVEVEYLPESPSINRVKGNGCESFWEWIWRRVGLGLFLLGMFAAPGVSMVYSSIVELRHRKPIS